MTLPDSQSLAPARTASIQNIPAAPTAQKVPHKLFFVGTYDPLLTGVVPEELVRVFGSHDAGSKFGFGFPLHLMVKAAEKSAGGLPMYVMPQEETVAAAAAAGDVTVTGTAIEAGSIVFYMGDVRIVVGILNGATADEAGAAIEAALSVAVDKELPALGVNTVGVVAVTAKSKGTYGDDIKLSPRKSTDPVVPDGLVVVITTLTGGSGIPDITDALNALGTGDAANEEHFTECVNGYGLDATTMDAVSTYNGIADEKVGCYNPRVARPMRWLVGDNTAGSGGLSALLVLSATRKLDRTNITVPCPGSMTHPVDAACEAAGAIALINNDDPAKNYLDVILSVDPGVTADRWTDNYPERDQAVKEGISTTVVKNGVLTLNKLVTFYRPDSVNPKNNGYRDARNVSITQNILNTAKKYFETPEWVQFSIVADVQKVRGTAKDSVKDIDAMIDALYAMADAFETEAWIYDAAYTKENLAVALREAGNGFDNTFPVIYSGQGDIIDTQVNFDIALTVFIA